MASKEECTSSPLSRRRASRRDFLVVMGGAVASAIAAACTPPSAPPTQAPGTPFTVPTVATGDNPSPAPADGSPSPTPTSGPQKGTLRLNIRNEPPTLDPNKAEDTAAIAVLTPMYDGMAKFKPDLTVEPAIAEKWDVSSDGKTYTFLLRSGVTWSDGKPLSAKDFEFSWKRLIDPRTVSPYSETLDMVVGAQEFNQSKATDEPTLKKLADAVGIKAIDARTLEVKLVQPAAFFPILTALWVMSPCREDNISKLGTPDQVVSGAFKLREWHHNEHVTLVRNENYYGQKAKLDSIVMRMVSDASSEFAAYLADELDLAFMLPDAQLTQIRNDAVLSKELRERSLTATYYFGFNIAKKPFDNVKVRQALSMAVDRKTFVEMIAHGVGSPAMSFIPPGMPGHQPQIGFEFNPEKAKKLLAEAGYPDARALGEITIYYNTGASHRTRSEFLQQQLQTNLGVRATIQNMEWPDYLAYLKRKPETRQDYIYRLGWNADYPDPNEFLRVVFASDSPQNYTGWKNEKYDQLVRQAAAEPDAKKRLELYAQAQQILVDEAPALFFYWYGTTTLVKPWVNGLIQTPQDAYPGAFYYNLLEIG